MAEPVSRRDLLRLGAGTVAAGAAAGPAAAQPAPSAAAGGAKSPLTDAAAFRDVSRVRPHPTTLTPGQLAAARLTPDTWRIGVEGDKTADVERPRRYADATALDLPTLLDLGKKHGVKYLKAMQCLNIPQPLGQGLWEGVPLRDVLRLVGRVGSVRRVVYWGFHHHDPEQAFRSSLSYTQVVESPPDEPPVFLAYRLNGQPLPVSRGGPVRVVVPWAYGFKSIK